MIKVWTFVFIPRFEVVILIPNEKYLIGKKNTNIFFGWDLNNFFFNFKVSSDATLIMLSTSCVWQNLHSLMKHRKLWNKKKLYPKPKDLEIETIKGIFWTNNISYYMKSHVFHDMKSVILIIFNCDLFGNMIIKS